MTARILHGKPIAEKIKSGLKDNIAQNLLKGGRAPSLSVILVGQDPASEVYVKNKRAACAEVGILSETHALPETISEAALLQLIDDLNLDPKIDGILVQLPLPPQIDTDRVIEHIHPSKDVDGFHPYNLGRLAQRTPTLRPCTPYGIVQLLRAYDLHIRGHHAVVVGASNIVGRPMALEFLMSGATVTICHRFTKHIEQYIQAAEIIVVATGVKDVIDTNWLHEGQILIDVGMHRLADGSLRGDVSFADAVARVDWITPVPGGVGPMTVATLLQNTVQASSRG